MYASAFAVGLGADEVVFVSTQKVQCDLASTYGANAHLVEGLTEIGDLGEFDVTVDTSGVAEALGFALRSTGPSGVATCTAGATHRGRDVALPVYEMYMNTVTFHTGWVHTRSFMAEPLALIADGLFDPLVAATTVSFDDAALAFAEPFTKLVLRRPIP